MEIVDASNKPRKKLKELDDGDLFLFEDRLYVKTEDIGYSGHYCVTIGTSINRYIPCATLVIPIKKITYEV